jgi:ABC-type multidrug transport system fused ATPase/permease subunit
MSSTPLPREPGLFGRGMRLVASYVRMHPRPFAASVTGALIYAISSIALTTALGRATDRVLRPAFAGGVPTRQIWFAVLTIMVAGTCRALGIMIRRFYSGVAGERVMATLRSRVADRYRELALAYHRATPTGELLAHMEADVKAAVDVYWPVPFAAGVVLLVLMAMVALLVTDPFLALVGLAVFPSLALMNRSFARRTEGPARRAQEKLGEVSESIDGAMIVKTLGREAAEVDRLATKARELRDERVVAGYVRATFDEALEAMPTLATVFLLMIGSWRVSVGSITTGDLISFIALFGLLAWPMRFIGWILAELPRAVVGYARLEEVFREPVTVPPVTTARALPEGPMGVEAEDLHLVYDGEAVLAGVSFEVQPEESVAIVGATGAGKSSLVQLLVRLADPQRGVVRVGGVDVREADPAPLRRAAAIVFQESFLFATSVRENIALDSGASAEDIDRAVRMAAVDRFVGVLPHGLDTVVGERGYTLSGGERQRVALARALVRRPRILILDDATSAVDPAVEAEILSALRTELRATLIVVAYRLATIRLADRVIFLEDGLVAGTGPHEQLLGAVPGYAAIIRAYERRRP